MPIAQYRLYTAPETSSSGGGSESGGGSGTDPYEGLVRLTSSMVSVNENKTSGVTFSVNDTTHDLEINFTRASLGILITDGNIRSSSTVTVYFDSITFSDGSTSPAKIGFYNSSNAYSITSGTEVNVADNTAIQFNVSSSYTGTTPITVTLTNVRFKIE